MDMVLRSAAMEGVLKQQRAFRRAARQIAVYTRHHRGLNREDVSRLFFDKGFFKLLYGGRDVRAEETDRLEGELLVIRSFTGRPMILFQFERPRADLRDKLDGLERDAQIILGRSLGLTVITDGSVLWLFRMVDGRMRRPETCFRLADMSPDHTRAFVNFFQHCQVNWNRQLRSPRLW